MRSEHLYRRMVNERQYYMSPKLEKRISWIENNRFLIYLGLFGLWQFYELIQWFLRSKQQELEQEILDNSFAIENNMSAIAASLDPDDQGEKLEISLDANEEEKLRLALDRYIRDRQSIYAEKLDEKILEV